MKNRKYSLKGSILAVVIALAATGIAVLIYSTSLYKGFVFEIERNATRDLIQREVSGLHKQLTQYSTELGITLQSNKDLRRTIKEKKYEKSKPYLNDHFHQYYVTAGVIKLEKIYLLDKTYQHLVQSTDGLQNISLGSPLCTNILGEAKQRSGSDRLKIMSGLCRHHEKSLHTVIVPVGTLSPFAYLQIITDPTFNANQLSLELGMPVKITLNNGDNAFQTDDWPDIKIQDNFLLINYPVNNNKGDLIYTVTAAHDISAFDDAFQETTLGVLSIALIIILIGIILSAFILKRSLHSLSELSEGARNTSQGNYQQLPVSGCSELDDVITSYNIMVSRVQDSQKALEKDIETATSQLRTALSTVEKRNSELEQAITLADQANTAKTLFLANMSHELRTPLNAVIGYSEMLEDDLMDVADEQAVNDLRKIKSAGAHLLEIVRDILELSKIESGKMEIQAEEFDLREIVDEAVKKAVTGVEKNNNKLHLELTSQRFPTYSDRERTGKIIYNLIDNAAKYTENGDISIKIEQEKYHDNDVYIIAVNDTGIGIPEEHQSKIFEPFQQVDNSSTRSVGGTGLGLALSKQLAISLGGSLYLCNTEQQGSTFCLRIPVRFEGLNK